MKWEPAGAKLDLHVPLVKCDLEVSPLLANKASLYVCTVNERFADLNEFLRSL